MSSDVLMVPTGNSSMGTQLVSAQTRDTFLAISSKVIFGVALLGITSNTANIVTYLKMGLVRTSNLCFFALSIADLFCACFIAFMGMVSNRFLREGAPTVHLNDVVLMLAPIHYGFLTFGSWVTAVISVERCCCVLLPLKVKLIFTRRTVAALLIGMVIYQIALVTPNLSLMSLKQVAIPGTNRTQAMLDTSKLGKRLGVLLLSVSFSIPTMFCFFFILVGTVFLVTRLRQSAIWRISVIRPTASQRDDKGGTTKEVKLARTVIFISAIYIVCFTPSVVFFVLSSAYPKFHLFDASLGNLARIIMYSCNALLSISSFVNIFVYLTMNSAFRKTFMSLCG